MGKSARRLRMEQAAVSGKTETPLRIWMSQNKRTMEWLQVRLCQRRLTHIHELIYGARLPTYIEAMRIQEVTLGAVPVSAWLNTSLGRELWHAAHDPASMEAIERMQREQHRRHWELIKRKQRAHTAATKAARKALEANKAKGGGLDNGADAGPPGDPLPDGA